MIVGQDSLLSKINRYTLDSWPNSCIFLGDVGCGKHTLVKFISDKFNLLQYNLTPILNQETIEEIYERPELRLYYIEAEKTTIRQQNMLLKLIEEPPKNVFIVIICESLSQVLTTIKNRCQLFEFSAYTKELLSKFITESECSQYILDIASTPGQVINYQSYNIKDLIELSEKIFTKISSASFSNTLSISNKIAFKDERDKINIELFSKILNKTITNMITYNTTDNVYYHMFLLVQRFMSDLRAANVDKRYLFDNFLCKLWRCSRNDSH